MLKIGLLETLLAGAMFSVISFAAPGQTIKGKATESSTHAPVAGVTISVKDKPTISGTTSKDGTFTLQGVPSGVFSLVARSPRYYPSIQEDVATGQDVLFELLQIKLAGTGHFAYADIDRSTAERLLPAAQAAADTKAVYLLSNRLSLTPGNDPSTVGDAHSAEAKLRAEPATISGSVMDASKKPLRHTVVELKNQYTGDVVTTTTDNKGQYEASVFPVGTYAVKATADGKVISKDSAVEPNQMIVTNLTLPTEYVRKE